jgi:pimeloyl-ACP methyl ester carboxylesterase
VLLFFSYCIPSLFAQPFNEASPTPPGKLIDIGGRRMHINCTGEGSPTVIAENGAGAFSIDWALVQREVSRLTQFCSYDRAGYAWSDSGPTRDVVAQTTDDLHLLLRAAGIRPPYILVGASIGGLYVRAYQRRFPDEVLALVLDDPSTDQTLAFTINGKNKVIADVSAAELRATFEPLLRNPPPQPTLPNTIEEPADKLPKELQSVRLWALRKFLTDSDISQALPSFESWREEFVALRPQSPQDHPLGNLPLIVLAKGLDTDEQHKKAAASLAALSTSGKLAIAERSKHEIHLYQPDLVVRSVSEILNRNQSNLR